MYGSLCLSKLLKELIMKRIKAFLFYITPRVYNLRDCIYIRWMNKEYIIKKENR